VLRRDSASAWRGTWGESERIKDVPREEDGGIRRKLLPMWGGGNPVQKRSGRGDGQGLLRKSSFSIIKILQDK